MRLDNVDPDTREWLRRHKIPYDHLLYDEKKYRTLSAIVDADRVVAVLDDQYMECEMAEKAFGPSVPHQCSNLYNRGEQFHTRIELTTFTDAATYKVQAWLGR
jgi:hypothetical protein